ncbi:MAG: hypothetical protein ACF8MF_01415 [Phycisphaerales bacterium JB052]
MATLNPQPGNKPVPTPLWAVLVLTFLGSLGTGAITNGFSFIATEGLGYSRGMNLLLALVLGLSYIAGALASGPIVLHLSKRSTRLSPRGLLVIVICLIALACQLPLLAQRLAPELLEISLWALIIIFSPMTGILWPIVEAYLSGGRREKALRTALGQFNVIWAGALVLSFWGMAPLLSGHPFVILSVLGGFQLLMLVLLGWFTPYPLRHLDMDHAPPPEVYRRLLIIFRVLLIASYIVLSALSPLLPIVENKLEIPVHWMTPLASVWLTSRVFMFLLFERWHGWHGRWWTPWTGMALMLIGFALCMGSPMAPSVGIALLIAGLAITGMGIAITYYGALYYAMSVGNSEVDAGGKHEAMIGMGYTLGPLCGLGGIGLSGGSDDAFRFWVILLISLSVIVSTIVGWRLLRRSRARDIPLSASPH